MSVLSITNCASINFFVSTGLGLGLVPFMPGTVGTLGGFVLYYLCASMSLVAVMCVHSLFFCLAVKNATVAERYSGIKDDSRIVIDEILAYWFVLMLMPHHNLMAMFLSFGIFRFFDIAKPWPIKDIEKYFPSGLAIMLDDYMASIYTLICLWQLAYLGL